MGPEAVRPVLEGSTFDVDALQSLKCPSRKVAESVARPKDKLARDVRSFEVLHERFKVSPGEQTSGGMN